MSKDTITIKDGSGHGSQYFLSFKDTKQFFQDQRNTCLSETKSGCSTNVNFVSKSGELVSAHQARILPRSSLLKIVVDSSKSCGCKEDVPTFLLPDWEHNIIQALVCLLYTGSVQIHENSMKELLELIRELCLDIHRDELLVEVHPPSCKSLNEEDSIHEKEAEAFSTTLSENGEKRRGEKNGGIHRFRFKKVEIESINEEQEMVRKKLNEVVDFLGSVKIKTEESLDAISKPLDNLLSALKYLPTEPSFDFLPTEIKTNILSYLCNSGTFVIAAVCSEWKNIAEKRLTKTEVKIGKHCTNTHACEDGKCFMPVEILKASTTLNLDVCLTVCYPVTNVDPKLLAEGLTSVPKVRIIKHCRCGEEYAERRGWGRFAPHVPQDSKVMVTREQMKEFIETLEQKNEVLKCLELNGLSMIHLDQEKLIKCLLKIERLFLGHGSSFEPHLFNEDEPCLLNGDVLIEQLENTTNSKITHIYIETLDYSNHSPEAVANALCQVQSVYLGQSFIVGLYDIDAFIGQMRNCVLYLPIRMENLFIFRNIGWENLTRPDDLIMLMHKLKHFAFHGTFSEEQEEVARSIPGVNITPGLVGSVYQYHDIIYQVKLITKGFVIDTSSIESFDLAKLFFNE